MELKINKIFSLFGLKITLFRTYITPIITYITHTHYINYSYISYKLFLLLQKIF